MEKLLKKTTELSNSPVTKRKIINSALKLFALKDFSSVSTREIASDAGVNLSLISYYFKTKDNLYSTIVESVSSLGLEFFQEEIDMTDELFKMTKEERISVFKKILYKYIDFIYSENVPDNFIILMIKEQTVSNSKFGAIYREKSQILYKALRTILASITSSNPDEDKIVFEICSIIGQILSFKLIGTSRGVNHNKYTADEVKKIKKILHSHIDFSLQRLNVNL